MSRERIILDIDNATGMPGRDVDDGLALAMALISKEVDLLGVTTCGGNCHAYESTDITLRMLALADRADVPVAAGRDLPILQDVSAHYEFLDNVSAGANALWANAVSLPAFEGEAPVLPAHQFIIDMVREYPGDVVIVTEGSFTNLAMALLVDPDIAPLVKSVVHMGGSIEPLWEAEPLRSDPELWRHILKFNTDYDPEASAFVFKSAIPLTFATVNVCAKVCLRHSDIDSIEAVGTPFHRFLADASRRWVSAQLLLDPQRDGAYMWDPLTLAIAIRPELCTYARLRCDPSRFLASEYPWLYSSTEGPHVNVTVGVDAAAFEEFMMECLTQPIPAT